MKIKNGRFPIGIKKNNEWVKQNGKWYHIKFSNEKVFIDGKSHDK